jgi:hypothetical protein
LKRTQAYSVAAVVLGLILVLVPIVALSQINQASNGALTQSAREGLKELEGSRVDNSSFASVEPSYELQLLAVCFVVVFVVYVLVKRRMTPHDYGWIRPAPY